MIRTIIFIAFLMSAVAAKAQFAPFRQDSSSLQKKWFITKSASISTGFIGFKGGSSTYLAAPLSYQLNRKVSDNLFAFAGVSAVPYVFNFNSPLYQPATGKNSASSRYNNYGISPAARIGMTYISNDKSFSISGSIGVSRSNYNSYSPMYMPFSPFVQ